MHSMGSVSQAPTLAAFGVPSENRDVDAEYMGREESDVVTTRADKRAASWLKSRGGLLCLALLLLLPLTSSADIILTDEQATELQMLIGMLESGNERLSELLTEERNARKQAETDNARLTTLLSEADAQVLALAKSLRKQQTVTGIAAIIAAGATLIAILR